MPDYIANDGSRHSLPDGPRGFVIDDGRDARRETPRKSRGARNASREAPAIRRERVGERDRLGGWVTTHDGVPVVVRVVRAAGMVRRMEKSCDVWGLPVPLPVTGTDDEINPFARDANDRPFLTGGFWFTLYFPPGSDPREIVLQCGRQNWCESARLAADVSVSDAVGSGPEKVKSAGWKRNAAREEEATIGRLNADMAEVIRGREGIPSPAERVVPVISPRPIPANRPSTPTMIDPFPAARVDPPRTDVELTFGVIGIVRSLPAVPASLSDLLPMLVNVNGR